MSATARQILKRIRSKRVPQHKLAKYTKESMRELINALKRK